MALSQGFLLPLPASTAVNMGAFKYHYFYYATYSLCAEEKSHPGKVVAHQGVFTFLKYKWAQQKISIVREHVHFSPPLVRLCWGAALCSRPCSAVKVKDTGTIHRNIVMALNWRKKKNTKNPFSLVKRKWGEENKESSYSFKIQVSDTLLPSRGWAVDSRFMQGK